MGGVGGRGEDITLSIPKADSIVVNQQRRDLMCPYLEGRGELSKWLLHGVFFRCAERDANGIMILTLGFQGPNSQGPRLLKDPILIRSLEAWGYKSIQVAYTAVTM